MEIKVGDVLVHPSIKETYEAICICEEYVFARHSNGGCSSPHIKSFENAGWTVKKKPRAVVAIRGIGAVYVWSPNGGGPIQKWKDSFSPEVVEFVEVY